MAAYRCPICLVNWPHQLPYGKCAHCGSQCSYSASDPIDLEDAESILKHLAFDRYYEARELDRHAAEMAALP